MKRKNWLDRERKKRQTLSNIKIKYPIINEKIKNIKPQNFSTRVSERLRFEEFINLLFSNWLDQNKLHQITKYPLINASKAKDSINFRGLIFQKFINLLFSR